MKLFHVLAVLFGVAILTPEFSAAAPQKYTFKKGQLVKGSEGLCGLVKGGWLPVRKLGKKYVKDKKKTKRCKRIPKPGTIKAKGLSVIPSLAGIAKQRTASASMAAVSGNPPTLNEMPAIAKTLFWLNNEVDAIKNNAANPDQCADFFRGSADGDSSGLFGCASVESVGRAFQAVLDGGEGTCFMSRVASNAALATGGIEVIDGEFPGGSIQKLFASPTGSAARTIKVQVAGFPGEGSKTGFVVIDSESKLVKEGNQYGYTSYFCSPGASTPSNYQRTTVGLDGRFRLSGYNTAGGQEFKNDVEATLIQSGSNLAFDLTKSRVAKTAAEDGGGNRFKVQVSVNSDNTIHSKVKERRGETRREIVSTSSFIGSDVTSLRVLESAAKIRFDDTRQQAAFEYRTTAYASAPGSALLGEISDSALDDSFFESEAEVEPNFSGKSCSADADITIRINFGVPALAALAAECISQRLSSQSFCFGNADIGAALQQFPTSCGSPT